MSFMLKDRVVVVTGGSSGIGLETVRLLLQEQAKVAWCGRNEERLLASEDAMRTAFPDGQFMTRVCDVLNADDVATFAEAVKTQLGNTDCLINNAGQGRVSGFDNTSDDDWMAETGLKLFGVIRPVRAFMNQLLASGMGSVTNVNSLLAKQPEPHMMATSAARAALLNFTHSLAHEYAPKGVRVNSILLGMVESGQWRRRYLDRSDTDASWEQWTGAIANKRGIPMGRLGRPEEPARALVFLASPLASYTTGSTLDVSGGFAKQI
ncbi:SDR family oxidoreductase [Oceanobacter sp. 5_MG-2023]|uniref:SDR family oxidoreductase n=1 Tax=Oceanobacter sp. 5_MG-2023 TaxID=3062645 RepID=UPI0026E30641|nr:SDR family oxidoreductase [Oceanobacter sp. 5_MG-2023]MDO6682876.1 SDR family oxidoreductase [Oceanobacter sp. 5_MG-2023]